MDAEGRCALHRPLLPARHTPLQVRVMVRVRVGVSVRVRLTSTLPLPLFRLALGHFALLLVEGHVVAAERRAIATLGLGLGWA